MSYFSKDMVMKVGGSLPLTIFVWLYCDPINFVWGFDGDRIFGVLFLFSIISRFSPLHTQHHEGDANKTQKSKSKPQSFTCTIFMYKNAKFGIVYTPTTHNEKGDAH